MSVPSSGADQPAGGSTGADQPARVSTGADQLLPPSADDVK